MSKNQQDLPYVIDSGDQPGDARLVNISNPQSSKKWLMHSPQNFFIFTLKFKSPSYVFFVQMKGLNTYKLDLTFKDYNRKFICQKSFVFETQDQLKLVEIWQHPFSTYVEVKLLNNRYSPLRMGLNYILFKGKTDPNFQPLDVEGILNHKQPNKAQIFKDRQTIKQKTGVVLQIDDQGPPKNTDIYFGDQQQNKKRHDFNPTLLLINGHLEGPTQMVAENPHQIILDPQTLPQHQQIQSVFPLTSQELQGQIIERTQLKKPYVTYAYEETREWWNILKFVRKEWVQGQKNIENQKNIAVEDRMSNKIQVKHLFRKKIMAEGLDPQRKNIIEQSGLLMGALIVAEPQPGCLVVTTREYGEKIRRMKKFKVSKVVTEEYIFNCKMFNALLNQQDYIIR